MASAGHHGIGLVRSGLAATTRVDMHVGDHAHAPFPAMRPKPRKGCLADRHLAGGERVRVDVIVEDELADKMATVGKSFAVEIGAAILPTPAGPTPQPRSAHSPPTRGAA